MKTMNIQTKEQNKSWVEEFDERFKCIQNDCAGGGHTFPTEDEPEGGQCQFCAEYIYPLKFFISAELSSVAKEMIEVIEKIPEKEINYHQSYNEGKIDALSQTRQAQMEIIKKYKIKQ